MDAWFALAGVAVGALVTMLVQLWTHRQTKQFIAAERRLEAHQQAFQIWWRMATGYHDADKRNASLKECQDFWNSNCLYLGKRTRKAFREVMIDVMVYEPRREQWQRGGAGPEGMRKLHADIEGVFKAILADADLPDLHESLLDIQKLLSRETEV